MNLQSLRYWSVVFAAIITVLIIGIFLYTFAMTENPILSLGIAMMVSAACFGILLLCYGAISSEASQ
jgi:hypothetical protein